METLGRLLLRSESVASSRIERYWGRVREMAPALSARYGRTFEGVGAALYRDGRDSVAWHGDKIPLELEKARCPVLELMFSVRGASALFQARSSVETLRE